MSSGTNLSKEFFELLKAIGESKSKQEEDRIILKEVQTLKKQMETPPVTQPGPGKNNNLLGSKKRAKEFLVRLLYVEMLGHDGSFGYIKAVEMAASASLFHKRTGYLVCGACLAPSHEFRFMLVNQMQRDLQSTHVLEICGGLLASTALITGDMVPAMTTLVTPLLDHASETVRKKAIICLHRFHQLAPESVTKEELTDKLRKVLCDRDPSVMGASLNVIQAMAASDPIPFKDLIPSLVSILKQIGEGRLPSDYEYHRVPAPWMQMKIIRILGILGSNDATASSGAYEILHDTLKKADVGVNAGYAVVYECVRTIVALYPNPTLLDAAAEAIARFIQSKSHNLKYLGVTGLAAIVESHPQYAAAHQLAVMDCLEDTDETLQRKTLDLLYKLVNPVNVEFITEKLLDFLRGTTDDFLKKVLTTRVCSVAERYAPTNAWYIATITELFEISGDMVRPEVAHNLMSLIAEGTGESEHADMLLRQEAVEIYAQLLKNKPAAKLPRILLETMAWCLGEYGYLSAVSSLDDILFQLCTMARKHKSTTKLAPTTRKFLISAIMKLVAQSGTCPPHAAAVMDDFTTSMDVDLQQRCLEFQTLLTTAPQIMGEVLPVDASCEDVNVDINLSFMDHFVQQAIANGSLEYAKPQDDDDDDDDEDYTYGGRPTSSAFNMTPYEKPTQPTNLAGMRAQQAHASLPPGGGGYHGGGSAAAAGAPDASGNPEMQLNVRNVASVWGKGGLTAATAPPPATTTSSSSDAGGSGGFGASSDAYNNNNNNHSSSAHGSSSGFQSGPPPPTEPEKPRELTEKERMAAALFGGVVPGAAPPPPAAPSSFGGASTKPPSAAAPPAVAAAAPVSAPVAPPEIDLLDMGAFDDAPAPAAPPPDSNIDIFAPVEPPPAAPMVETVQDDNDDDEEEEAAPPQEEEDPFAAQGLLGGVSDAPLASLGPSVSANKFEFNGAPMAPLEISTAQYGQQWGACAATSPISLTSTKVDSLDAFMNTCAMLGAYKVESISATNEGICAGMCGATHVALIHGKVSPNGGAGAGTRLDVTVKSNDATLSGSLAVALQNKLR